MLSLLSWLCFPTRLYGRIQLGRANIDLLLIMYLLTRVFFVKGKYSKVCLVLRKQCMELGNFHNVEICATYPSHQVFPVRNRRVVD